MASDRVINRAVAKQELERIDGILREPHLLIGGLAVQQYHSARISRDIDLVCDFETAQHVLESLYPTKDWRVTDSRDDEYRPSYRIEHKYKTNELGTIKFGPKISEREPYRHVDWEHLARGARPFQFGAVCLQRILVPPPHALAYSKMVSFLCRQDSDEKTKADLKDFTNLTNHDDFSISLFYDLLRHSRAADDLIGEFRRKAASYPTTTNSSCLSAISEMFPSSVRRSLQRTQESTEMTVYLAAPHRNIAKNNKLKNALLDVGFNVKIPYDEVKMVEAKREDIVPGVIRSTCIKAIDACDLLVVDLDTYGLDTAWEIGYAEGMSIPMIGFNDDIFMTTDHRYVNRRAYLENFMHGWHNQSVHEDLETVANAISGKRVYLCGPFSRPALTKKTRDILEDSASFVVYPSEYLAQQKAMPRDYPLADRSETNRLLEDADILLVALPRYGMDSSWQIGYATALGKEIVGWKGTDDEKEVARQSFWDHWMHAWQSKPHVVGVRDLVALLLGMQQVSKNGMTSGSK